MEGYKSCDWTGPESGIVKSLLLISAAYEITWKLLKAWLGIFYLVDIYEKILTARCS